MIVFLNFKQMELNVFKIKQLVVNEEFINFTTAIAKKREIRVEDVQRLLSHNIITIDSLAYLVDKARSNVVNRCVLKSTKKKGLVDPYLSHVENIWFVPKWEKSNIDKPGPGFIEVNKNCWEYIKNCLGI